MRSSEMEHLFLKLLERRLALLREVSSLQASEQAERDAEANDRVDRASKLETDRVLRALGDAEQIELAEINAALERIDQHRYGRCETCGARIPERRLEAIPEARTCLPCSSLAAAV
jgi:DnaK suppressor protein